MAKYLQGKQKKKHSFGWFLLGMFIYAAVVLTAAGFGLKYLWSFLDAYEKSRPELAQDAYMEQLTEDYIVNKAMVVTELIDRDLQSDEEVRQAILDSISGGVDFAKNSKECTETRKVYVLHCGKQVIGSFSIRSGNEDKFGFTPWSIEEDSFDFSFLVGQPASITVPSQVSVFANGRPLDAGYITEGQIRYEELEDYYDKYDMPYKVTYTAGPILGDMKLTAKDADGNELTFDDTTDWSKYYVNVTKEESKALSDFTEEFVARYVAFTGSNKNTRYGTHKQLMEYVVSDSNLANRLEDAVEGLQFGQSKGDKIVSLNSNLQLKLGEGKYICDITYEVDTTGKKGVVRTTTNAKLTIVENKNGLLVESMIIY